MKKIKCCVLGDGAWGTAIALTLFNNGHECSVWGKFQENVDFVNTNHANSRFLPGVDIPSQIKFTTDMREAVNGCPLIVLATPSQFMRGTLEILKDVIDRANQTVADLAKGIELDTLLRMSELFETIVGGAPYVAISGPSHAEEVSRRVPTLVVAASRNAKAAKFVQQALMNEYLRVYTCSDVTGVELGGALKNIFAIAAGIADGAGMGDNTKAALMTRGIAEMARLGVKLGGRKATFSGLSGIGDLIVTCTSRHSRNRHVGEELGRGRTLDDIISSMNMVVAEGVKTCESARALAAASGVETPIINGLYEVLHNGKSPQQILRELMTRKARSE